MDSREKANILIVDAVPEKFLSLRVILEELDEELQLVQVVEAFAPKPLVAMNHASEVHSLK